MNLLFYILLGAVPLTFYAEHAHWSDIITMLIACVGIIPLARFMGQVTESISHRVGPTAGGLINATFGNACELIIALFALKAGMLEIVKASITGSIIGNILLVLGGSMFAGGLKHNVQRFNPMVALSASTSLTIMTAGLVIPAALHYTASVAGTSVPDVNIAMAISALLLALYFGELLFNLKTHRPLFAPLEVEGETEEDTSDLWGMKTAILVLLASTIAVVFMSEVLVDNVEVAAKQMGMSPVFIGVVLLAIVGNAAENSTAILMARKNKMDLSINIALGSSRQIAMFVAPVIVFAGYFMGQPMNLVFSLFEILAVGTAVVLMGKTLSDGQSNWYEGFSLLILYTMFAICFYYVP